MKRDIICKKCGKKLSLVGYLLQFNKKFYLYECDLCNTKYEIEV